MNKFKLNYDKMVDDQYGLTNAINATMEFANGKFNKNYKMNSAMDDVAETSVRYASVIPQISGKGSPNGSQKATNVNGKPPVQKNTKKGFMSDMSTVDKIGMGMNAMATIGSMVAATKGIIDTNNMKKPKEISYETVEPDLVEDSSGARKAAGDAEIDSAVAANMRINEAAGRIPDDGTLSTIKLDAERKNAAQIEGERQQVSAVNAQMKNQAKGINAQLSLSANAQNVQNLMQHNAMRTQLKTQNVNTLIEAPMNMAGSLISYNNAKETIGHARKMEKLNMLYAQRSASSPIDRAVIDSQITKLLSE